MQRILKNCFPCVPQSFAQQKTSCFHAKAKNEMHFALQLHFQVFAVLIKKNCNGDTRLEFMCYVEKVM